MPMRPEEVSVRELQVSVPVRPEEVSLRVRPEVRDTASGAVPKRRRNPQDSTTTVSELSEVSDRELPEVRAAGVFAEEQAAGVSAEEQAAGVSAEVQAAEVSERERAVRVLRAAVLPAAH